jgi:radical SAM-linked protein
MSHLDNLRLFERILRRAGTPVQYSQGFNPTMKLSYGPPLPLGFTSEAEVLDIVLDANLLPYMVEDIRRALPDGITMHEAKIVLGQGGSLSALINRVEYVVPVSCWSDSEALQIQIGSLLSRPQVIYRRESKDGHKEVDLRPAIRGAEIAGDQLVMSLAVGESGYARPNEVATFLSDGLACEIVALPFHRRAMYREADNGRRISAMEL